MTEPFPSLDGPSGTLPVFRPQARSKRQRAKQID